MFHREYFLSMDVLPVCAVQITAAMMTCWAIVLRPGPPTAPSGPYRQSLAGKPRDALCDCPRTNGVVQAWGALFRPSSLRRCRLTRCHRAGASEIKYSKKQERLAPYFIG